MRSATGVELDPRSSLALHEFRWSAADHELGQDAQELPSRSSGSDMKISISGLSSSRAAEFTSWYMAGSLALRPLMPLASVSWPRPLGARRGLTAHGCVRPLHRPPLCGSLRCLASRISNRSARIIGKEVRTFRGRPRLSLDRYHAVRHGEDESLQSRRNLKLRKNVRHMGVYRSHAEMKPLCDLLVTQALGKGLKHLALSRR
jgi:hypothetical protein